MRICRAFSIPAQTSRFTHLLLTLSAYTSMAATANRYRSDGVRITHDPFAPGMAEKYGAPGKTDSEGFDPYADSVGPGIYGGIVKRDELGQVVIGRQYQNHNPRPGPVYAGGGYTPMCRALGDDSAVLALLVKFPDLVNDISSGGAQPLHNCGMSQTNQLSTALLIAHGADIEALDTYGFTPLHRMATNNLAIGAKALLDAGADPTYQGAAAMTPLELARSSHAFDVMRILQEHGNARAPTNISSIHVGGAGADEVNGLYEASSAAEVPEGFDGVCQQQGWDTKATWQKLNGGRTWYRATNGAYIFWNSSDKHWWIDKPDGNGAYKAVAPVHAPPQIGWKSLGDYAPAPNMVATMRQLGNHQNEI